MLKRVAAVAVMCMVCCTLVFAEEFTVSISKVADGKVTFAKTKFNKDTKKVEKGEDMTLPVDDKVKVVTAKFNKDTKKFEAGDDVKDGLKNEMFTKIDAEKGVRATIITDADNKKITEIRVMKGGKGAGGTN
jgi:hypothetical protein